MQIQKFTTSDNIENILQAIEDDGAVIINNALPSEALERLNHKIDQTLESVDPCEGIFHGYKTKRFGALIDKYEECQHMVIEPVVLSVMDRFLLPHCEDYQINLTQLISIGPGERAQILHPDSGLFPYVEKGREAMINVMWAIDDFTVENGATRVAPGSHKWEEGRLPNENELTNAVMDKGSCLIYLGRTIHGGGANVSDLPRKGIVMSYCLGWLRQAENQYLSISQEKARELPEKLQRLIGYFVHNPNLGAVNGKDPIYLLQNEKTERIKFKDFMHEEAQEILNKHYNQEDSASWADVKGKAA